MRRIAGTALLAALLASCSKFDQRFSSVEEIGKWGWKVDTPLDLGGWEIWQVESSKGATIPSFFRLYAVKGRSFRKIRSVGGLASLLESMQGPGDAAAFVGLLVRGGILGAVMLDGLPGVGLSDFVWDQIVKKTGTLRIPLSVAPEGDGYAVERVVGQYGRDGRRDRAILVRELIRPGRYRWEEVRVICDDVWLPRSM